MITLITGVPGSGKTLWAVKLIQDYLAEGRTVYADIDGLSIPGVEVTPLDWRETPDGSVCVYDECQQKFGPDGKGRASNPVISALEVHRHTGHDIIFITQRERLLHAHIRDLVGKHYHIQRMYGSHNVKIYRRDETIDTKSVSMLNQCDQQLWTYDKKLFDCYKSATIHTHKRHLPTWLKWSIGMMLFALVLIAILGKTALSFLTGEDAEKRLSSIALVNSAQATETDPLIVTVTSGRIPLMGCAVWDQDTQCQCFDVNGYTADLPFGECMKWAKGSTLSFRPQVTANND